jgi:hypothetical protein
MNFKNKLVTLKTGDRNSQTDEFKLNGEIFKKFLEHYEKRANGTDGKENFIEISSHKQNNPKLVQSLSNSNYFKTQENYPEIKSLRNNHLRKIATAKTLTRPRSEYNFDKYSSKIQILNNS